MTAARIRFVLEAAFIVVVAAVCWAANLSWRGIVPAMAATWVIVTLVERSATRGRAREAPAPAAAEEPAPAPPPPSHVTVLEQEEPRAEHPPTPMPPEPESPTPEPAPPVPEPEPTPEPGEPVPQLEVVPEPEPEPEPQPEAEPEPIPAVAYLQPRLDGGGAREWNVWELERLAREIEGRDPARDEELAFLLIELRQFANADGQLAASFDPVVRSSFGDLLYTPS